VLPCCTSCTSCGSPHRATEALRSQSFSTRRHALDVQHEVLPNGKGHRVRVHWGTIAHTAFGDTYTEALDRALDALEVRQGLQAD
jgi:hypothetical protein